MGMCVLCYVMLCYFYVLLWGEYSTNEYSCSPSRILRLAATVDGAAYGLPHTTKREGTTAVYTLYRGPLHTLSRAASHVAAGRRAGMVWGSGAVVVWWWEW